MKKKLPACSNVSPEKKYYCIRATELYIFMTLFAITEHFTCRNNYQVTPKLNEIDKWAQIYLQ